MTKNQYRYHRIHMLKESIVQSLDLAVKYIDPEIPTLETSERIKFCMHKVLDVNNLVEGCIIDIDNFRDCGTSLYWHLWIKYF